MYCISAYKSPAAVSRNLCPENPAATKWDPNKISWALDFRRTSPSLQETKIAIE